MQASAEMQAAWTQYWNIGLVESLPKDRAAGRLAEVDAAWKEFLSSLPEGSRLLDLATGGGDVIRTAIDLGRKFQITGVDLADLTAVRATFQTAGIELVGNTDLSKLPFPDSAFDGMTSQFGIEYADAAAATREAMRVLAPGGRGCFVLHHADGAVAQGVARSLAAYSAVFADDTAFQSGRKVFELYQRSAARDDMVTAEAAFEAAVGAMQARLRNEPPFGPPRSLVAMLQNLARSPGSYAPLEALRKIDSAQEQIHAGTLRKVALMNAALNRTGIAKFSEYLASAGATVDAPQELKYQQGKAIAWRLAFRKP